MDILASEVNPLGQGGDFQGDCHSSDALSATCIKRILGNEEEKNAGLEHLANQITLG